VETAPPNGPLSAGPAIRQLLPARRLMRCRFGPLRPGLPSSVAVFQSPIKGRACLRFAASASLVGRCRRHRPGSACLGALPAAGAGARSLAPVLRPRWPLLTTGRTARQFPPESPRHRENKNRLSGYPSVAGGRPCCASVRTVASGGIPAVEPIGNGPGPGHPTCLGVKGGGVGPSTLTQQLARSPFNPEQRGARGESPVRKMAGIAVPCSWKCAGFQQGRPCC